ncbi:MAG: NAD(P)/FAD-dependent oxidoreductase [Chloroflexi bacterium]|nr:NAD(P)/FAD-dependent oxidoreductase [Chloroflexota bacterium]
MLDVVVVGGSVAGLSAALYLGRSLRQTVVVDEGKPANRFSHASHGFLTRDGVAPGELLQMAREQLQPYETVTFQTQKVTEILPQTDHFLVKLLDDTTLTTRKVLLAMGLRDGLPPLANIEKFWGRSVFHCPYCDGWEVRDQPVALYANGDRALHVAKLLRNLTADLVICTGEAATFSDAQRQLLLAHDIQIIETPIARLAGQDAQIQSILFADGTELARRALFIQPSSTQHSDLAAQVGCALNDMHRVIIDEQGHTTVAGLYAAGDMTTLLRQVAFAVVQGATAAITINMDLINEDFRV